MSGRCGCSAERALGDVTQTLKQQIEYADRLKRESREITERAEAVAQEEIGRRELAEADRRKAEHEMHEWRDKARRLTARTRDLSIAMMEIDTNQATLDEADGADDDRRYVMVRRDERRRFFLSGDGNALLPHPPSVETIGARRFVSQKLRTLAKAARELLESCRDAF
jgi:hypothetical protein